MGNREPAVKSKLKRAARKHKEGKLERAHVIAESAGEAAAQKNDDALLHKIAKAHGLPWEIVAIAERAFLEETLP